MTEDLPWQLDVTRVASMPQGHVVQALAGCLGVWPAPRHLLFKLL